jgi:Septum formation initiator
MTIRREKNRTQAAHLNKRQGGRARKSGNGARSLLSVVPRSVAEATGEARRAAGRLRPALPRWIDPHPGIAILVAAAIIAAVCFLYVSQVTNVSNVNYELQALQDEQAVLQRRQDDLRLQIAQAQSLTTIADKAARKLQMVPLGDHYSYLPLAEGPLASLPPQPTAVVQTPGP